MKNSRAVLCDECGKTRFNLDCRHNPSGSYTCNMCTGLSVCFKCDNCKCEVFNPEEILYIQSTGSYLCSWCNPTHPNFHLNGKGYPVEKVYKPLESFLRLLI